METWLVLLIAYCVVGFLISGWQPLLGCLMWIRNWTVKDCIFAIFAAIVGTLAWPIAIFYILYKKLTRK